MLKLFKKIFWIELSLFDDPLRMTHPISLQIAQSQVKLYTVWLILWFLMSDWMNPGQKVLYDYSPSGKFRTGYKLKVIWKKNGKTFFGAHGYSLINILKTEAFIIFKIISGLKFATKPFLIILISRQIITMLFADYLTLCFAQTLKPGNSFSPLLTCAFPVVAIRCVPTKTKFGLS